MNQIQFKLGLAGLVACVLTMSPQAAVIGVSDVDFATGFVDGAALNGQQGWNAQGNLMVNTGAGGSVDTTNDYERAIHSTSTGALSDGDQVTLVTEFTTIGAYPDINASMFGFGLTSSSSSGDNPLSGSSVGGTFGARATGTGIFLARPLNFNSGNLPTSGTPIDLASTTANSAWRLIYTYTHAANAAASSWEVTVTNLTDATSFAGSYTGVDATAYAAAGSAGLFPFLAVTDFDKPDAGGDALTTFSITKTQVIPEPATLGLVAVFGGGVLLIRRLFLM